MEPLAFEPPLLPEVAPLPEQVERYPRFRYMGSKFRLLPWLHSALQELPFDSAIDAFSGSGGVAYLLKAMGKEVVANDSLVFPSVLAKATVANSGTRLGDQDLEMLLGAKADADGVRFIRETFSGIFYSPEELGFLDDVWVGIRRLDSDLKRAVAIAALLRSAVKRQPRGLFTVAGDPERYKDGRRDLQLTLREHFVEQVEVYHRALFSNRRRNRAFSGDIFEMDIGADLVYMDPPYVPRSDDNCYIKRYHFLEGLACYWEGKELMMGTKVRKIAKPFTPFSYRKTAVDAFDRLFRKFSDSTLVLSYSSNAFPDLDCLRRMMGKYKRSVEVLEKSHRYHFGTHEAAKRNIVQEYLVIGSS